MRFSLDSLVRLSLFCCSVISLTSMPRQAMAQENASPPILDADNNGLYDEVERKILLDEFLKASPELSGIIKENSAPVHKAKSSNSLIFDENADVSAVETSQEKSIVKFDADGDGKVTILEMNKGHEPLSVLMPPSFLECGLKIPWAVDVFPEWLSSAYFQEDVPVGPVEHQPARGNIIVNAEQLDAAFQPTKLDKQGVAFAANTGQFLKMPMHRDARWNYRWGIFTFRVDGASGADGQTVMVDINKGETSSLSSPKIWYDKQKGLSIQFVGTNKGGVDKRIMTAKNVVTDGKTWNVAVFGIRQGQMFASVNGVPLVSETKQPPRFSGEWPAGTGPYEGMKHEQIFSYIGDQSMGNITWAYDSLIFGLSEPSEAMVRKMTGWAAHRLGFAESLPDGHPYRTGRPVLDAEDFPDRYVHDDVKWTKWGQQTKDKGITRVNAGGPRVAMPGFERVFFDDFHIDRISRSTSGEADLWGGPGFNIAVGGGAQLVAPGDEPNAYVYDPETKNLILSVAQSPNKKSWRGSSIYTVNDMGWGYTWKGPKIFRIRCMFPKTEQKDLAGVLWPAFWSYGTEQLFWRTANRIENDYFEFDGENGSYLNGLSSHFHYAYLNKNIHARNPGSFQRYKVYGAHMNKPENQIPGGLFVWDGKFHTWEYVLDKDWTYINVTIAQPDGQEQWVEVCRVPTTPTYLQRVDLQMSYAFHQKKGQQPPKDGKRQDFVIDWVEVLQRTEQIDAAPVAPFTARPELTGESKAGSTITCTAKVGDITDVRYYWFADGYPLTYGPDNTYVLTQDQAGKSIRCLVQAVGARDQPEAWSNVLK